MKRRWSLKCWFKPVQKLISTPWKESRFITDLEEDPQIVPLLPQLQQRHRPPIRSGQALFHAIGAICQKQYTKINTNPPPSMGHHLRHPAGSYTRGASRHVRPRRHRATPTGPLGPLSKRGLNRAAGLRGADLADRRKWFSCTHRWWRSAVASTDNLGRDSTRRCEK